MVYATVIGDNVEALLGFDLISTFLHNRTVIKDLQKFKLYGTCKISGGVIEAFAPESDD